MDEGSESGLGDADALGVAEELVAAVLLEAVEELALVGGGCELEVDGATELEDGIIEEEEGTMDDELEEGANVEIVVEEAGGGFDDVLGRTVVVVGGLAVVVEAGGAVVELAGSGTTWALTFNVSCKITAKANSHVMIFCMMVLFQLLNIYKVVYS